MQGVPVMSAYWNQVRNSFWLPLVIRDSNKQPWLQLSAHNLLHHSLTKNAPNDRSIRRKGEKKERKDEKALLRKQNSQKTTGDRTCRRAGELLSKTPGIWLCCVNGGWWMSDSRVCSTPHIYTTMLLQPTHKRRYRYEVTSNQHYKQHTEHQVILRKIHLILVSSTALQIPHKQGIKSTRQTVKNSMWTTLQDSQMTTSIWISKVY